MCVLLILLSLVTYIADLQKWNLFILILLNVDSHFLLLNAKLKAGEKSVAYCLKYSAMCLEWKDKRDVRMLTSCMPDKDIIMKRQCKEKAVPFFIDTYNNGMVGVDCSDQMMSSYPLE